RSAAARGAVGAAAVLDWDWPAESPAPAAAALAQGARAWGAAAWPFRTPFRAPFRPPLATASVRAWGAEGPRAMAVAARAPGSGSPSRATAAAATVRSGWSGSPPSGAP